MPEQAVEGSGRSVVDATNARADPFLAQERDRRLKQIHHASPLVAVEVVEQIDGGTGIDPLPTNEPPNMGPVLLLDVCVVVFLVRPATGELDLVLVAEANDMMVNELAAVI